LGMSDKEHRKSGGALGSVGVGGLKQGTSKYTGTRNIRGEGNQEKGGKIADDHTCRKRRGITNKDWVPISKNGR